MKPEIISPFFCFLPVLLVAFDLSSSFSWIPYRFRTHYVRIVSNFTDENIEYHCKSEDDDLGQRILQPKKEWELSFKINFWGTTRFYCYFWYQNFNASFDVFDADVDVDLDCGGDHCIWTAQKDGFYLLQIKRNENVKKYDWTEEI